MFSLAHPMQVASRPVLARSVYTEPVYGFLHLRRTLKQRLRPKFESSKNIQPSMARTCWTT